MLIGLISDTHDNIPRAQKAVERFKAAGVDLVLHAGDFVSPFCAKLFSALECPVTAVFGNNDGDRDLLRARLGPKGEFHAPYYEGTVGGMKLLMMHEPYQLEAFVESQKYDVIVYGHTHAVDDRESGRTRIINPGECGGWLSGRSTIALLELPGKKITVIDIA